MELCRKEWTKEDYTQFITYLEECGEETYQSFHSSLVPGQEGILGIRMPKLRAMAKEIAKGAPLSFLQVAGHSYNEENVLQGAVIGILKEKEVGWDGILEQIRQFVPHITNWGVCDTFCSSLKITKKHKAEMFEFLRPYARSEEEYEARFAFVMFLSYYMEEAYVEEVFALCDECRLTGYYVQMAIAWLVSIAYIKCRECAERYLEDNKLDTFTYNKALQKIVESNRISKEEKALIRKRKRK